ncbi:MAG TPA: gluconate 2-dehydrogenase subunit 3 family protein [Bryobacterales bacterium]|nr:gluconate 2-dehydrogenase subunit 3 family protein [Bryobacterales bacterium]
MNRRQLMKSVIAGAGATMAGRTAPAAQSHHAAAAPSNEADSWKPAFFDQHQNETVVALSDLIIPATDTPGAKAAQVNRYIDLMLSQSPSEAQRKFLEGLGWLDGYALRTHGAPFVNCSTAQQTALLESLDPSGQPAGELRPGAQFFREIKRRVSRGYYTSKIGIDDLNKGGRVPASFGCPHDGHTG